MGRLNVTTLIILAISASIFGQEQDLIDENSLKLALRNVIEHVESSSNNFYAYKIGQVRNCLIYSILKLTLVPA